MTDLLTILKSITPFASVHEFVRLCWYQLAQVIGSKEADEWDWVKRSQFMELSGFLVESGRAVFIVRDTLIKNSMSNLNESLTNELAEPLTWLDEFSTGLDWNNFNELLNECTAILVNGAGDYWESITIECVASYLKMFFTSVYSLEISVRMKPATSMGLEGGMEF